MIQTFPFLTQKSTRFSQIGTVGDHIKEVWFALHGYGQLAPSFAEDFSAISSNDRLVVCPEALSRFYTSHRTRTVGATWMTYEDREFEILDYVAYLDDLAASILSQVPADVQIGVFGFSQGCHTATRWIGNDGIAPDRMILWGSDPAHDLSADEWSVLADIPVIQLVAGSEDRYLPEDRIIKAEESLRDHQCTFETHRYEGGHDMIESLLCDLIN